MKALDTANTLRTNFVVPKQKHDQNTAGII